MFETRLSHRNGGREQRTAKSGPKGPARSPAPTLNLHVHLSTALETAPVSTTARLFPTPIRLLRHSCCLPHHQCKHILSQAPFRAPTISTWTVSATSSGFERSTTSTSPCSQSVCTLHSLRLRTSDLMLNIMLPPAFFWILFHLIICRRGSPGWDRGSGASEGHGRHSSSFMYFGLFFFDAPP